MVGLDVSPFAPEIARALLLRGTNLPPVLWKEEPNRGAKRLLDETDDAALFAMPKLANEPMGAAVRALLYMWTGWLAECRMFGGAAPKAENLYMSALCERHSGRFNQAKESFTQLGSHPIYPLLSDYATSVLGNATDPSLQRLAGMLQQDQRWEPYLFCDAVILAALKRVKQNAETLIRQIVCREFELLFVHCYEAAVGQKLAQRVRAPANVARQSAQVRERRIREERRRREEEHKRQEFITRMDQVNHVGPAAHKTTSSAGPASSASATASAKASSTATAKPDLAAILCPKCSYAQQVSAALRGKIIKCPKCGTSYLVPN